MTKTLHLLKNTFYYIFGALLLISFYIHYLVLKSQEIPLNNSKLIESYLINGGLVFSFLLAIKFFHTKFKDNIGYIFIAVSLLKFVLFFIFINPTYKLDDHISTIEFTSFFIPYFICMLVEIIFLSKFLNNLKF